METIYVLIKVNAGSLEYVCRTLNEMKGIIKVDSVTGSYDVVVTVEGRHVAELLSKVVRDIRNVEGIISTETLVALTLD